MIKKLMCLLLVVMIIASAMSSMAVNAAGHNSAITSTQILSELTAKVFSEDITVLGNPVFSIDGQPINQITEAGEVDVSVNVSNSDAVNDHTVEIALASYRGNKLQNVQTKSIEVEAGIENKELTASLSVSDEDAAVTDLELRLYLWADGMTPIANRFRIGTTLIVSAAPSNLRSASDSTGITLTWEISNDNLIVEGYQIWRKTANGNFEKIADVQAGQLAYTDQTAEPFTTYQYYVEAVYGADSASSDIVIAEFKPTANIKFTDANVTSGTLLSTEFSETDTAETYLPFEVKTADSDSRGTRTITNGKYLYIKVDDNYADSWSTKLDIAVTYLDVGTNDITFQYCTTDTSASNISYKSLPNIKKGNTERWKTATFSIDDARFVGDPKQNTGADFRIGCSQVGMTLHVSEVTVINRTDRIRYAFNSYDAVSLEWQAMSGAAEYEIYRNGTKLADISETSYVDTGLELDTEYYYGVYATVSGYRILLADTKLRTEDPVLGRWKVISADGTVIEDNIEFVRDGTENDGFEFGTFTSVANYSIDGNQAELPVIIKEDARNDGDRRMKFRVNVNRGIQSNYIVTVKYFDNVLNKPLRIGVKGGVGIISRRGSNGWRTASFVYKGINFNQAIDDITLQNYAATGEPLLINEITVSKYYGDDVMAKSIAGVLAGSYVGSDGTINDAQGFLKITQTSDAKIVQMQDGIGGLQVRKEDNSTVDFAPAFGYLGGSNAPVNSVTVRVTYWDEALGNGNHQGFIRVRGRTGEGTWTVDSEERSIIFDEGTSKGGWKTKDIIFEQSELDLSTLTAADRYIDVFRLVGNGFVIKSIEILKD